MKERKRTYLNALSRSFMSAAIAALMVGCATEPSSTPATPESKVPPPPGRPESLAVIHRVKPESPQKALEAYQQAVSVEDWEKCWAMLAKDTQAKWSEQAAQYRKKYAAIPDGPERRQAEKELKEMGYLPDRGRVMDGNMLMVGVCRSLYASSPEGFRAFAGAARLGNQQMGRHALVDFQTREAGAPGHVMTVRSGVLWYLIIPPPAVIPNAAPPKDEPKGKTPAANTPQNPQNRGF